MTEPRLFAVALGLGARDVPGWSTTEEKLARDAQTIPSNLLDHLRDEIRAGLDPLGEVFADLRGTETRRELGATYTPLAIVDAMLAWAAEQDAPARVIDPGAGSGRFLLRAARRFKRRRTRWSRNRSLGRRDRPRQPLGRRSEGPQPGRPR